jgi:hypothetical protein
MCLFLILVNYIAALVSVQLLRGDITPNAGMNFGQLFTAFLAIWQIFSSENWTNVLYLAATSEVVLGQTIIVTTFLACWFLFSNCKLSCPLRYSQVQNSQKVIVLQMFIAVINENFNVAEELKKDKQASNYWEIYQQETVKVSWMRTLNPYRWLKPNPVKVKVENLPSSLILPIDKTLVQEGRPIVVSSPQSWIEAYLFKSRS